MTMIENDSIISPIQEKGDLEQLHVNPSNELVRFSKTHMSLLESRIVRYIIAQISMNDDGLFTYKIDANHLADAVGIDRHNVYPVFKELSSSFATKVVHVETGEVSKSGKTPYLDIPWFGLIGYDKDDNIVLRINPLLEEYVLSLKAFTDYKLTDILALPSDNCIKLYELIMSWRGRPSSKKEYAFYGHRLKKNEIVFSIEYLKEYFDCTEKYKKPTDFIKRIIEPNINPVNEIIGLKYNVIKQGKKIVAILFILG